MEPSHDSENFSLPSLPSDRHVMPFSEPLSSSPLGPPSSAGSKKPKKPAPITPRRFNRFFTPRSTKPRSHRALTEKSAPNYDDVYQSKRYVRASHRSKEPGRVFFQRDGNVHPPRTPSCSPNRNKKRKLMLSPDSSPIDPSPSKRVQFSRPSHQDFSLFQEDQREVETDIEIDEEEEDEYYARYETIPPAPQPRIRRSKLSGPNSRLLLRSFGGLSVTGRGRIGPDHCTCRTIIPY
jgi:hypothetical protein